MLSLKHKSLVRRQLHFFTGPPFFLTLFCCLSPTSNSPVSFLLFFTFFPPTSHHLKAFPHLQTQPFTFILYHKPVLVLKLSLIVFSLIFQLDHVFFMPHSCLIWLFHLGEVGGKKEEEMKRTKTRSEKWKMVCKFKSTSGSSERKGGKVDSSGVGKEGVPYINHAVFPSFLQITD